MSSYSSTELENKLPSNELISFLQKENLIKWEFVEWIEKSVGECIIKGCWFKYNFEATGVKFGGEIVEVYDIKNS